MARPELRAKLGPLLLDSPLIAASGTVGSVWEWQEMASGDPYGAAVAKSVAPEPWEGRPAPRIAPTSTGMLNGIGIQNPGIDAWAADMEARIPDLDVKVWGSAVAHDPDGFGKVASGLERAGVEAVEVNLSCPNLDSGTMFSFEPASAGEAVAAVRESVEVPVGAKLSPNTPDIVAVAAAVREAGADFVVLTNTAFGLALDMDRRKPVLSGGVGGYSGPGLKPISMRCVYEVASALPGFPIVGCGGVSSGVDVLEYVFAGASAVSAGTIHLAEPRAGERIIRELEREMKRYGLTSIEEATGAAHR